MKRKPEEHADHFPAAVDVESSVLGVILLRDSAFYEMVAAGLCGDCFSLDSHCRIFHAIER